MTSLTEKEITYCLTHQGNFKELLESFHKVELFGNRIFINLLWKLLLILYLVTYLCSVYVTLVSTVLCSSDWHKNPYTSLFLSSRVYSQLTSQDFRPGRNHRVHLVHSPVLQMWKQGFGMRQENDYMQVLRCSI